MNTVKPGDFRQRTESYPPFTIRITTYQIGGIYHCTVDNVDPGAVIARSEGGTREEAEEKAVERAHARLQHSLSALKLRQELG